MDATVSAMSRIEYRETRLPATAELRRSAGMLAFRILRRIRSREPDDGTVEPITCLIPPQYLRSTSVALSWHLRFKDGGGAEAKRRYSPGDTDVSARLADGWWRGVKAERLNTGRTLRRANR
jgi:hypothetical protein